MQAVGHYTHWEECEELPSDGNPFYFVYNADDAGTRGRRGHDVVGRYSRARFHRDSNLDDASKSVDQFSNICETDLHERM